MALSQGPFWPLSSTQGTWGNVQTHCWLLVVGCYSWGGNVGAASIQQVQARDVALHARDLPSQHRMNKLLKFIMARWGKLSNDRNGCKTKEKDPPHQLHHHCHRERQFLLETDAAFCEKTKTPSLKKSLLPLLPFPSSLFLDIFI